MESTPTSIADPKMFYQKISGTRDIYRVADLEGQLRNTIVARMTDQLRAKLRPVPRHGG